MRKTNEINLSQDSIDAIASTVAIAVTKAMAEMLVSNQPETSDKKSVSKSTKTSKTSQKKSSGKKQSSQNKSEKQTWEDHLTETFGDKETRSKFVELRNKVDAEFKTVAKSSEKYIPRKQYQSVLNKTTESLNGRFNKAKVKAAFLAAAK